LVDLTDGRKLHFEDYMIREGAPDAVESVDLGAAQVAAPAPGVLEAIAAARIIVVCPSNPVVSIGPILAVPGIAEAISRSAAPVVAVSPIVGGAPVKGPASQLLRGIGVDVSALGVARHYRPWIDGYVFDQRDAALEPDVKALGLLTRVTDSMMVNPDAAAHLAAATLELAESRP
jgi:LPPG:FO 2-phospho-L-lactate transferase